MKAQLRLIKKNGPRALRLHQCRREADETKGAVRQLTCEHGVDGILLLPLQLDQFWIRRHRSQLEIVEEGSGKAHEIANLRVGFGMRLLQTKEKRRQVFCTGTKDRIVVDGTGATYLRELAGV